MCLAIPGRILSVSGSDELTRSGRVDFGGVIREANLALVPEAREGDYVLVHVGMALGVVDEAEARRTLDYLRQMDELAELEAPASLTPDDPPRPTEPSRDP